MAKFAIRFVYIAGPYSGGDVGLNVAQAISTADALRLLNYVPFVPHLCHFWHYKHPHQYEYWMSYVLAWLPQCDAVLRLAGESPGADVEVERAKELNIPVFYSIDALRAHDPA